MRSALAWICLAGLLCAASRAGAGTPVWIEAERFDDPGGWTADTQFIPQMGSPYLLAIGLGSPVTDAVTCVELPRAGRWHLWVRAKDWVPEHHPGRFHVLVDGRPAGPAFGASGRAGWRWEDGGEIEAGGRIEVRLRDLTGWYGRCDALVFADEPGWKPPDDPAALAALRERLGGAGAEIADGGEYDVIVAGGGLAGCVAAVSAARLGARTLLLQDRDVFGGNASSEILVPPVGVWPHGSKDLRDPRDTGLIEEAGLAGRQAFDETRYWSARMARLVRDEPGLEVRLRTRADGVEMKAGETNAIAAVQAADVRTGRRTRFRAGIFVDCTGDGAVGVAAGAVHRTGREPRSMYGESLAPEQGDATTMGNSLKYHSRATGSPQPFATPAWATPFPACDSFPPGRHPPNLGPDMGWQWMLELGGTRDTWGDREEIRDDLLRLIFGIWGHLKNDCPRLRAEAADRQLDWVGHVTGIRESRRLIGDYVFTERDIVGQTLHPDRVAYGGWGLDDHFSEGFLHRGPPANHPYKGRLHSIPYRSLYSTNIVNLLMAGRNISASHVGMGTTRVMMTCAVVGQAAGTAAALCVRHGARPRELVPSRLEELQQQLLKDGAYLIGVPNRDPRDLARRARVTATSEARAADGTPLAATNVINGVARAEGPKANAWMADTNAPGPHRVELEWPSAQSFNTVHVTFFTRALAPERFDVETWDGQAWRPVAAPAQRLRRHVLAFDRVTASKLRVTLPAPAGVCEIRVYDEEARDVETARRAARKQAEPDGPDARFPWEAARAEP